MKKLILSLLVILVCITSACADPYEGDLKIESVDISYGESIEIAKKEFETIFSGYEGLRISTVSTMDRTDDADNIVVQITYTSDNGDGVYGFELQKDAYGNWEILQHGEDVTMDNLVKP